MDSPKIIYSSLNNNYTKLLSFKDIIKEWSVFLSRSDIGINLDKEHNEVRHQFVNRFKYELERKKHIEERFGPTETYVCDELSWKKKKCPQCWRSFTLNALNSPIRCTCCAYIENSCCTGCIITGGVDKNVPISPHCAENDFIIKDVKIEDVPNLKNLEIVSSLATTTYDLIQFTPKQTKFAFFAKGVLVNDRFARFERDQLKGIIGEKRYDDLINKHVSRRRNVTFKERILDLNKAKREYFQHFKDIDGATCYKNCNWEFTRNEYTIHISDIGPIQFSGHVILKSIFKDGGIVDKNDYEKDIIHEVEEIFPDGESFADNVISKTHCHSVAFKPGKVEILQTGWGYKNKETCWGQLTLSEKRQKWILQNVDESLQNVDGIDEKDKLSNKIYNYYNEDEINKFVDEYDWNITFDGNTEQEKESNRKKYALQALEKEPKLQVVDTEDVNGYINTKHKKLVEASNSIDLLSNILSYGIATQIHEVKPTFWQHLACNESLEILYPHGSYYRNKDYIKYFDGAKVMAHVDHADLHQTGYNFGPYIIYKFGEGDSQILCSVSNKSNGCEWDRSKMKSDRDYGGHIDLPPGTVYWMFDEGAFGGISHSIHNAECLVDLWCKELFGTFKTKSYTMVMRPKLKSV